MNFTSQMKAWAIDRAIETLKIGGNKIDYIHVIDIANKYCEFTAEPEIEPEQVVA